jgi:RNA polymerase sigma factor (TIGR02999 family)
VSTWALAGPRWPFRPPATRAGGVCSPGMSGPSPLRSEITDLLAALRGGDRSAMDRLMPLVYEELRSRAHQQLGRARRDAALSTTGLVHEVYLKLVHTPNVAWEDRNHFFAVASKAMRSVVVDHARRQFAQKRGGGAHQVELEEDVLVLDRPPEEILAIHEALDRLVEVDARLSGLVEMRFFGGLSMEEIADVVGVSVRTVKRDWNKARVLLFQMLRQP